MLIDNNFELSYKLIGSHSSPITSLAGEKSARRLVL